MASLTIDDKVSENIEKNVNKIWNCDSTRQRHVIIKSQPVLNNWGLKMIKNNKRAEDQPDSYTTLSNYFFKKCAILLSKKENNSMIKARKERHFLDVSK